MSNALTAPIHGLIDDARAMDRIDVAAKAQTVSVVLAVLWLGWGLASLAAVNMARRATWTPGPDAAALGVQTADPLVQLQDGLWVMTEVGFGGFVAGMLAGFAIEWMVDWDE